MSCVLTAIVSSLPLEDPNVDKLQAAIDRLGTICSMEVDDTTKRAAVFWALGEAIDGFPASLVGSGRRFIDAIDVDEVFEVSDPRPASETLRCTLWLFSDCLLITKRPRGDRTGKSLAGLDNPDRVVQLYQTAHLSSSQATLLGSPKRLRKGVLGSRGLVNLCEMVAVDLGTSGTGDGVEHEFGLLLDDPPNDQSSRWNGRPARRYVVAGTTMPEQRGREKESFLASFGETLLQQKLKDGASATYRGAVRQSAEADAGEVYWALWQRRAYESLNGAQKVRLLSPFSDRPLTDRTLQGKLALHLVEDERAGVLTTAGLRPNLLVRVTLLGKSGLCCFEASSKGSSEVTQETIPVDRIPYAMVDHGASSRHCIRNCD